MDTRYTYLKLNIVEINIFQLDSSQYQEGITILDFESIYFSVGLDMVGDPVWFADRTNFPSSGITATQIQTNGNFTPKQKNKGTMKVGIR